MGQVVSVATTDEYDSTYDDDRYEITLSSDEFEDL